MATYKNPLDLANSIEKAPRKFTVDDARNHIRAILGQDRNNSVLEAYDDYLMRKGQPSAQKQIGNDPWFYPKGHYKTVLADDEFLTSDVLPYLDEDNFYGDWETSDNDIENNLAFMGYKFK